MALTKKYVEWISGGKCIWRVVVSMQYCDIR